MTGLGSWKTQIGVILVAFVAGFALGLNPMTASAACPTENWTGSSAANIRYDDADGVDENNTWFFLGGDDLGRSLACNDNHLYGDVGDDDLGGGSGNDYVEGENGPDHILYGGKGTDIVTGGPGYDVLIDNEGPATGAPEDVDDLFGDEDNDSIDVQDGDNWDLAAGGAGSDTCLVDHTSEKSSC